MPALEQLAAEQFAAQQPAEIVALLQPIMDIIKPAVGTISALVGGLFGLYLIFVVARLYYEKRKLGLLKNINYDLDYLNQHFNLPYSREKETPSKVIPLGKLKVLMEDKERKAKDKLEKKAKKEKEKREKREREKKKKAQRKKVSSQFPISIRLKSVKKNKE